MVSLFENFQQILGTFTKKVNENEFFMGKPNKRLTESQEKGKIDKDRLEIKKLDGEEIGIDHPFDYQLLESSYLTIPTISCGVDTHVDSVLGSEYKIETKTKSIITRFEEFTADTDFDTILRSVCRNMLIYGSAFVEIVWQGKKVKKLKILDSKSMYIKLDNKGNTTGYSQFFGDIYKNNNVVTSFKNSEILHFSFNKIGSCPYGTSIIRPLFGDGEYSIIKLDGFLKETVRDLLEKQLFGKLHVKVGDPTHQASQGTISKIATDLETSKNLTEWVTSYLVDMKVIGYNGKTMDLSPYLRYCNDQMVYGLKVPEVLMGSGSINEGLANVQSETFERRIKSIRLELIRELENLLFDKLFGKNKYSFMWNRHEKKDMDELNVLIRYLADKFVLTPETRNVIENRIRDLLSADGLDFDVYKKSLDDVVTKKLDQAATSKVFRKADGNMSNPKNNTPDNSVKKDDKDEAPMK